MGLEPSFSRNTPAWPFAGPSVLPLEPGDPALAIPRNALCFSLRDTVEQGSITGIDPTVSSPQAEPSGGARPISVGHARRWPVAVAASCVLHAAVALAFFAAPMPSTAPEDPTEIEGANQAGMMVVGNASSDQAMAGDVTQITLVPVVEARPIETIEAEPIEAESTDQLAAEAPVTEALEPVTETPQAPVNPEPEILAAAAELPDSVDNFVEPPARISPAEPVETVETPAPEAIPTPQVVEVLPKARPAQPTVQAAIEQKPKPPKKAKPVERAEQAPETPARKKAGAGSGGANAADVKRGVATGKAEGEMAIASSGGALSGVGNAAVSNYPGKVAAKLRRVSRNLSRAAQASARNNAQVSFVVGAGGDVRSVQLAKSSGSPGLDEAALSIIRRAAPFPPIPPQAGRTSWAFTVPIGPF